MFSPIEKFDIVRIISIQVFSFDLSVTNLAVYTVFGVILVVVLFFLASYRGGLLPSVAFVVAEAVVKFVFSIVDKQLARRGYIFFPFLFILFLFILSVNIVGMLPLSFAPTAHIAFTFYFSITLWVFVVLIGLTYHGFHWFTLFVPNVPQYMLPFLVIIEVISFIMRVFSLAIRLAANITAGHILLLTLSGFVIKLAALQSFLGIVPLILVIAVLGLELGVAFLQAFVFVTLVAIYLNDSINLAH